MDLDWIGPAVWTWTGWLKPLSIDNHQAPKLYIHIILYNIIYTCVYIFTNLVLVLVGFRRPFGQMDCRKHVELNVIGSIENFLFRHCVTSYWHARSEKAYQGGALGFY